MVDFTNDAVLIEGIIILPMVVGQYPKQSNMQVDFLVVKASSAYNTIIGRPSLNALWDVVSTYYLKMKFLINYRIEEVKRDQALVRHCYTIAL